MKKILAVVIVLLLLGGGYYLYTKQVKEKSSEQSGGLFGSIKDALSKQLSLQCNFTTDDGIATVAYIKAGAVRVDSNGKTADQMGSFIMKDKKMYFWQTNSKQGTVMDVAQATTTPAPTSSVTPATTSGQEQSDNVLATIEKFKDKCKAAIVTDSLFTPPSDVKFTDVSDMMKAVPTAGGQPNQEQIQQMMRQYQPTGY